MTRSLRHERFACPCTGRKSAKKTFGRFGRLAFQLRSSQMLKWNQAPMIAIRQVGWVTTSRLLSRGSLVATSIILARNLDVQAFAAFSYFLLTISMLAVYASMGLGVTTNRYFVMGDNPNAQQSKTIAAIVAISVVFSIALVLVVIILPEGLLVGEFPIPRWVGKISPGCVFICPERRVCIRSSGVCCQDAESRVGNDRFDWRQHNPSCWRSGDCHQSYWLASDFEWFSIFQERCGSCF